MSRRSLTCLSSIRALRATTCAALAPLAERHRAVVVDQPLRRAEDERERRAQLVADVGEELRLDLVELADALEQALQLDVLLRDLPLLRLLLGDVAPFGADEHDLAVVVDHRHERGVDDDRLLAAGAPVDRAYPSGRTRPCAARAIESRMPWLISSETCHQKVVQNGFPSTSASLMPTASSATLLISSTVPWRRAARRTGPSSRA